MNDKIKQISGGITAPKGFLAAGSHIGLKRRRRDLSLIVSERLADTAAIFTTNVVKAAPLLWCEKILRENSKIKAIVINSGNANACTGGIGKKHAEIMAKTTANSLDINENEVFVSSTGVIGVPLPIDLITEGIKNLTKELDSTEESSSNAAQGIMTTDTFHKEIAIEFEIDGKPVKIGGIAKGSGMIHPNMATMLAFITTDVNLSHNLLDKAMKETSIDTYNMISVDGDTSTNDMAVIMANGLAGNSVINNENENYIIFKEALYFVNEYLAKQIAYDGEGATKFLEVIVKGLKTKENARKIAKSIISSNLVKTAIFGEDANWGRVLAAAGYSGIQFDPSQASVEFVNGNKSIQLMKNGIPLEFDENTAKEILANREIKVIFGLQEGKEKAKAWGCDLSYEYVRINGEYRT